jgi:hypothetical protein
VPEFCRNFAGILRILCLEIYVGFPQVGIGEAALAPRRGGPYPVEWLAMTQSVANLWR